MDVTDIAPALKLSANGWWTATQGGPEQVSYPPEGNTLCLAIEDVSFWFAHRNDCILKGVRLFPPAGCFLDIGGGNGFVARAIQEAGFDVVMVEPGIDGVRSAVRRGVRHVVRSTSDAAGIRPESAGGIGLFDVVEHIEEDVAFLRKMRRLLAPQGRVYITVPAYNWLWSNEDSYAGHARRYTLRRLGRALDEAGFTTNYQTYIFGFLPPFILISRTIPCRLGLARKIPSKDSICSAHEVKSRIVNHILRRLTKWELDLISKRCSLRAGGSCLIVAQKV